MEFNISLRRKAALSLVGSLIYSGLGFIYFIFLLRVFPPDVAGEYFYMISIIYLFNLFTLGPFSSIMQRYVPAFYKSNGLGKAAYITKIFVIIVYSLSLLFSFLIGLILFQKHLLEFLIISWSITTFFLSYSGMLGWNKFREYLLFSALSGVFKLLIIYVGVQFFSTTIGVIALSQFVSNVILLFPLVSVLSIKGEKPTREEFQDMMKFGLTSSFMFLKGYVLGAIDTFFIGTFYEYYLVSAYSSTVGFLRRAIYPLLGPLRGTLISHIPLIDDEEAKAKVKTLLEVAFITFIISFIYTFLHSPLISFFFPNYAQYSYLSWLYIWSLPGMLSATILEAYFLGRAFKRPVVLNSISTIVVGVLLNFILGFLFGVEGVVVATVLTIYFSAFLFFLFYKKPELSRFMFPKFS